MKDDLFNSQINEVVDERDDSSPTAQTTAQAENAKRAELESGRLSTQDVTLMNINDIRLLLSRLNPVQLRFVKTFLETQFNMESAAKAAGLSMYEARATLELNNAVRAICMWYMNKQAVPEDELIARLSLMARADVGSFLRKRDKSVRDKDGNVIDSEEIWELDIESMQQRGLTFLIKKLSYSKDGYMMWELHNPMDAIKTLMKAYGMFEQLSRFQVDWNTLNQSQIERIARGEDPRAVVISPNVLPSTPGTTSTGAGPDGRVTN
jgi:hypothetical protein